MFADDLNRIAGLYEMGPDGKSGRERRRPRVGIGKAAKGERAERYPESGQRYVVPTVGPLGRLRKPS